MNPTTAMYLAKSYHRDLEIEAAKSHRAALARGHRSDDRQPTRWGVRLPQLNSLLRRRAAAGAATA